MDARLSILDLAPVARGQSVSDSFKASVALAQLAEELGYQRVWYAEHHNMPSIASSATSVLIAHVGAQTSTIRLGSGGIMLPNHSPLVIAEQFGTLEAWYPGRIDLGLGRAPGGDFATMQALRRDLAQNGDDFPALLHELQSYLGPARPGQRVHAYPGEGSNVPITLLGSSTYSAALAAAQGLPFAFAAHFAPQSLYAAAELYLNTFRPSESLNKPHLMVAVQVIGAETDAAAQRLFTTPQQRFLRLIRNQPVESLPPVDSMEDLWQPYEREAVEARLAQAIVGSDATVKAGLERLIQETHANEVIAVTDTWSHQDRLDSYTRLAHVAKSVAGKALTEVSA
jgi:luciferase family oxidoreductase group 1